MAKSMAKIRQNQAKILEDTTEKETKLNKRPNKFTLQCG
jgi:hypothetical protein